MCQCPHVCSSVVPVPESGFTLPELLMTLALVAILGSVAVPGLQNFVIVERQRAALNVMVTALHLARTEAIVRRVRTVICPSVDQISCIRGSLSGTSWERGYMVFVDSNANHLREPEERIVYVFDSQESLRISSARGRDHVTFQSSGMASGTNLTFHFCHPQRRVPGRSLVVSNSGRVRVVHDDGPPANCPG